MTVEDVIEGLQKLPPGTEIHYIDISSWDDPWDYYDLQKSHAVSFTVPERATGEEKNK